MLADSLAEKVFYIEFSWKSKLTLIFTTELSFQRWKQQRDHFPFGEFAEKGPVASQTVSQNTFHKVFQPKLFESRLFSVATAVALLDYTLL